MTLPNLQKVPPQNIEAEQSILGGILLDNEALYRALEVLAHEDFYKPSHQKIFKALVTLSEKGEPADLVTLTEELKNHGSLDEVGGSGYLATLMNSVPTAANVPYYAKIVREKSILRRLILVSSEIITRGYEENPNLDAFLDSAEKSIFDVSNRRFKGSFTPIRDIVKSSFKVIEQLYEKKEHITGVPSGFEELDRITSGFQSSDLIIIAGRPSMGKTSLVLNIAQYAAIYPKIPTAVFSLEMSKEQLVMRMLTSLAKVDASRLRIGRLNDSDWPKLTKSAGQLSESPIFIDDSPSMSVLEIRAKCRRLKAEHHLGLIVIDYLQLMRGSMYSESREKEISEISRGLKALAKELSLPVIALSQLNRSSENRQDKRPQMSDLRECVTGDTLVVLKDGQRAPIKDLVNLTPEVLAVSPQGKIIIAQSDKVWRVGKRSIYKVCLASGRTIRTTDEHRLFGANGWVRVKNLHTGDRLALARQVPEPKNIVQWPDERVALLGHLIGDGSYLSGQPLRYTTGSDENSKLVKECAEKEFGAKVKLYPGKGNWHQLVMSGNGNRWTPKGINAWLRNLGIFNQRSHYKRVPKEAFKLSNSQIALLLQHLWATDGTIVPRRPGQKGSPGINFSTASIDLSKDVAFLLLRLGIIARIREVHQRKSTWFTVNISGMSNIKCFLDNVGAFGPRIKPASQLARSLLGLKENTNVDTLPKEVFAQIRELMSEQGVTQREMQAIRGVAYGGSAHFCFAPSRTTVYEYASILKNSDLKDIATNDLFWDRVINILPDGEEEVYDLTVPGPSSWLADGIVSHNSGALEQDADVIGLLYRDEFYNKESEWKGTAELNIAKQRSGPIGLVRLAFLHQYTTFENLAPSPQQ